MVKFNDTIYEESYLCVRDDSLMKEEPVYEDVADIKNRLAKVKEAAVHFEGAPLLSSPVTSGFQVDGSQ